MTSAVARSHAAAPPSPCMHSWWDALPSAPTHRAPTHRAPASPPPPAWIDALRARPGDARDILLAAGYSYDGPDLVLRTPSSIGGTVVVRGNAVLARARPGSCLERYMDTHPRTFAQCETPGEFRVLPETIYGSLYYQPACEYPHGFRSLADKILKVERQIGPCT